MLVEAMPNPTTGALELVVSVRDRAVNRPETAGGRGSVRLECLDRGGQLVLSSDHSWPLGDDFGSGLPHAHEPIAGDRVAVIESCRLRGTRVRLEGRLTGRPG